LLNVDFETNCATPLHAWDVPIIWARAAVAQRVVSATDQAGVAGFKMNKK
jgi:hypothetical protein